MSKYSVDSEIIKKYKEELEKLGTYTILQINDLAEVNGTGFVLSHNKTKARVSVVVNDEDNKVFAIGFRTPPTNSKGIQHIVEHTVLCGSKKYPAKDPFVELAKGSLNTFLNAMTYGDKTVYPIASCND
ncbi:MAG: insulinase family protein, partial [Eubacterium sp.]|nr:insulinase family protein [Eubacterium sp.]